MESDGSVDFFVGNYEVDATRETKKEQRRADRLRWKQKGRAPAKLPSDSLRDQVLIAFRPEVSAQQAVVALEKAIQSITAGGLLIGTDPQRNIAWEQTDGHFKTRPKRSSGNTTACAFLSEHEDHWSGASRQIQQTSS
jgi:hypothetical protein